MKRTRCAGQTRMVSRSVSRSLLLVMAVASLATAGCISSMIDSMTGEGIANEIRGKGLPAEGTIIEIWETGVRVNGNPVVGFRLEVRAAGREPWIAETKALISILEIPRIQPGKVLLLEFDPEDPTRIALLR